MWCVALVTFLVDYKDIIPASEASLRHLLKSLDNVKRGNVPCDRYGPPM